MKSKDKRLDEADELFRETYIAIRHLKSQYNQNQNGYKKTTELMNRIQIWRREHKGTTAIELFQQEFKPMFATVKCQQPYNQEKIR